MPVSSRFLYAPYHPGPLRKRTVPGSQQWEVPCMACVEHTVPGALQPEARRRLGSILKCWRGLATKDWG
jgi:hypothetical protein